MKKYFKRYNDFQKKMNIKLPKLFDDDIFK